MPVLLFILYCGLCGFGILKIPFFRKSGIRPAVLLTLFGLHVLAGCLHNLIAWRFYPEHGDIWFYFQFSFLERHRLLHDMHLFLYYNSSWDAVSHNAITFIQIILDAASFDDMWINTLLLSFPVFLGNTALYRVFRRQFPGSPLSAVTAFLLPSTLFWTSCIHREAVLFMLLGLLFYWLDKSLSGKGTSLSGKDASLAHNDARLPGKNPRRALAYASCAFLAIIFFRFAVALALIPALLVWLLTLRPPPRRRGWIIGVTGTAVILLFFLALPQLSAKLLRELGTLQHSFLVLQGNSRLYLPVLNDSWASLLEAAPAALRNGLFEPLPGSGGQQIYQLFSLELLWIWAIVAAALLRRLILHKPTDSAPPASSSPPTALPFSRCCILFALISMLQIGLFIPFAGAIIRYRSIYLPFLVAPCLFSLRNWQPFQTFNTWLSRYFG
jgi:hypothetical protein